MEISKDLLKKKFIEYNSVYFNNELEMCKFHYSHIGNVFGRYMRQELPNGKERGEIWISKRVEWDEEKLKQVMIHEMIHHYVDTIDGKSFDGFFQHGRHFIKQIKRLKRDFGYEVLVCQPYWCFKNEKPKSSTSQKITHFLRNKLHLF